MAIFYDQENDEGGSYEPQHYAAEKGNGGNAVNLGHGPTCDRCNDAVLADMESKGSRSSTFHQAVNNLRSFRTDRNISRLNSIIDQGSYNAPDIS